MRADAEYVRAYPASGGHHNGATMAATADSTLALLLEKGRPFDYAEVRDLSEPKPPEFPVLTLSAQPDLRTYDTLLTAQMAAAEVA